MAPLPFDRAALARIVERRLAELTAASFSSTFASNPPSMANGGVPTDSAAANALQSDLQAILGGRKPRRYGEMPTAVGAYSRICPATTAFDKATMLLRRKSNAPAALAAC